MSSLFIYFKNMPFHLLRISNCIAFSTLFLTYKQPFSSPAIMWLTSYGLLLNDCTVCQHTKTYGTTTTLGYYTKTSLMCIWHDICLLKLNSLSTKILQYWMGHSKALLNDTIKEFCILGIKCYNKIQFILKPYYYITPRIFKVRMKIWWLHIKTCEGHLPFM